MTNQQHPITPPPELVSDWRLAPEHTDGLGKPTMVIITVDRLQYIVTQAARWGADMELEACCEWVNDDLAYDVADRLRTARRPKPPSLKEQALQALYRFDDTEGHDGLSPEAIADDFNLIRRALEQLDD